jgi:hypothetical protein
MIRLRIKNRKLMKNKQVQVWLKECEMIIGEEMQRQADDLMAFGSAVVFRPNPDRNNDSAS